MLENFSLFRLHLFPRRNGICLVALEYDNQTILTYDLLSQTEGLHLSIR